jgi:hypothetical protein
MKVNTLNYSVEKVISKIKEIDLQDIEISDHTREYLKKYCDNDLFYISAYSQLLQKATCNLNKPINESTFIDYGGGCGILSYAAKELGFKTIVYNDIYKNSVRDARTISNKLNIIIDYYFCGDVNDLINDIKSNSIYPDLICSFDVLEHIYDLKNWINSVSGLNRFSLFFMTGSNPKNPFIVRRLKKIHKISEYQGCEKNIRIEDNFLSTSILEQRRIIIKDKFPDLSKQEIDLLSKETRGLRKNDIEKIVFEYLKTGKINYRMAHSTNTCDPYTGNWSEKLIDLQQIETLIRRLNMTVKITNSYYCYSEKKFPNIIKYLLNQLIKLLGPENLLLSPTITLEIQKQIL